MIFGDGKTNLGYFSVTYATEIGGMRHVPQVCYRITEDVRGAILEMEKKNLARSYSEEVRFISGMPMPVKRAVSEKKEASFIYGNRKKKGREFS